MKEAVQMIITISGMPGSGKSTLAKEIAEKLGLKHYSAGGFMREIAGERGVNLLELGRMAEHDKSIDRQVDLWTEKLGKTKDNFIIDSRLAWHFIPNSIKIFLEISMSEAARRVYKDMRKDEQENTSMKKTFENMKKRLASEKKRYRDLYGINYLDKKNFDIIINSTHTTKKQKLEKTIQAIKRIMKKSQKNNQNFTGLESQK
ncbi:MAG: cytidylate kinase family protein [Candidatus ainarchaeum sp.]|nr:cytidylate kinase family protein [Candidatus ainarchaeum sp.]